MPPSGTESPCARSASVAILVPLDRGDRPVAIKVLGTRLGGDEDFARRFRRECALAAKVLAVLATVLGSV